MAYIIDIYWDMYYYIIMKKYIKSHIKSPRLDGLPEDLRLELKKFRVQRGWTQVELGRRTGLPQTHISAIETGKVVPRFDTLLDLVRVLGGDLLMIPSAFLPGVQAIIRAYRHDEDQTHENEEERPLYELSGGGGGSYSLSGGNNVGFEIDLDETEKLRKPQKEDSEEDNNNRE